ncbi:MAG: phosphatidylglycerophosphatase A [Proteobacteria bacterium]|nr:MAG: phosphatidylglycerophosphatase A [Pseudomonadota bacterium]
MSSAKPKVPYWSFASLVAVVFPLGMLPKAPGTWGSLAGIPVAMAFAYGTRSLGVYSLPAILILLVLLGVFAWWTIDQTEKQWQTHDDGRIVIDEVLGQAIASVFFPFDAFHIIAAFVLFRIFDIFKPGPIGWADEKLPGAFGTLLDDVIAGIFAGLVLAGVSALARLVL